MNKNITLFEAPGSVIDISHVKTCECSEKHLNCLTAKEWIKDQLGVWQFQYESRDMRNKSRHPATYPVSLSTRLIKLFTHEGELVLDPFVGSGTTLVSARDVHRNAVGIDLKPEYIELCAERLSQLPLEQQSLQVAVCADAITIPEFIRPNSVSLILTSPPYANLLNRKRKNKSRRGDQRKNEQFGKVEQYSQDDRDLGTMEISEFTSKLGDIYERLLPLLRPKSHCVINVPDMWWEDERITIHMSVIEELRKRGFEFRNTIIWDRTNIVNRIGIFGWPSNYITMGTTFEYLLDFRRPPEEIQQKPSTSKSQKYSKVNEKNRKPPKKSPTPENRSPKS